VSSKKTQLECLIKWVGYTDEHNTWEVMDSLTNCEDVVAKYKEEHKLSFFSKLEIICMGKQDCKIAEKNVMAITTPRRKCTLSRLQVGLKPYLCNFLT
jgi:hypothetical protein